MEYQNKLKLKQLKEGTPVERKILIRHILLALLTAGLTAGGAAVFWYTGNSTAFWAYLTIGVLILAGACVWFTKSTRMAAYQSLEELNRQLEEKGEKFAFSPEVSGDAPEMDELCGNIRGICNQLVATQMKRRNQKRQFDFILANMNEGFLMVDADKRVIALNGSAAQILGIQQEAGGKDLAEIVDDKDILEAVDKAIGKNKVTAFDVMAANGSIYSLNVKLVRNPNFVDRNCIMIALFDVTAERTALKQRQDFFSNASHELKTPITSILGFAELLEAGLVTEPEKAMDSVKIIRREARRMTRIIDDLLFISKLENDGDQAPVTEVNVRELLEEIKEALTPSMMEKNISLEISGGEFVVPAAYGHMHNLFGNLIQNAVKYNVENGSVFVRVERDDKYMYLTVKDTGIGIPQKMQQRVFERFFRVDKGRSRSVGGTGLGLAIVKHIVSLYDGTVTLESALGKGTTVTAKLRVGRIGA